VVHIDQYMLVIFPVSLSLQYGSLINSLPYGELTPSPAILTLPGSEISEVNVFPHIEQLNDGRELLISIRCTRSWPSGHLYSRIGI
jgi:hypothetical protein